MSVFGLVRRWMLIVACVVTTLDGYGYSQSPESSLQPTARVPVAGRVVYEKIPVTFQGPDPGHVRSEPVRDALVELLAPTGEVVGTSQTDSEGRFLFAGDSGASYRVRVLASLAGQSVTVADNTRDGMMWAVESDLIAGEEALVRATDQSRVAGAFNVLDVMRRATAFVRSLDPELEIPALTIYWSPFNTDDPETRDGEFVGGTRFDPLRGSAFVLGDRRRDSDEFDDDVLLHEFAHFLAARFSSDDSTGGAHGVGDVLDPRVAWSEGWANFFPAFMDGDPSYVDSGSWTDGNVLHYDLESNRPGPTLPGYWSEQTVHALLWDLVDAGQDSGDVVSVRPGEIWRAFRDLAHQPFVYIRSFLDNLVGTGAIMRSELEQLAWIHFLDFRAATQEVFPRHMDDEFATGELDSWSEGRTNLARSAHLYGFGTSGGAVRIDLDITGLGAGRNPAANDLNLILMDEAGRVLRVADDGRDGESERISTFLPRGYYVVEIRSFSGADDPGSFNSGAYRLRVSRP